MRFLSVVEAVALAAPRVRMCYLVQIDTPVGVLRFSTAAHSMTYAGETWLGAGRLLDIKLPQEDASLESHTCQITLDGLDAATISLALNTDIENSPCIIRLVLFDPDTNLIIGAHQFHRGTVGQVRITPPTM